MAELRPAVVFDINVYVKAIAGKGSEWPRIQEIPPATSNAAADCLSIAFDAEEFRVFASPHILRNTARVLQELGLSPQTVDGAMRAVLEIVRESGGAVVEPPRHCSDVHDHEDNLIMDLAVAVDAFLVVSDDTDLTSISPWRGRIPILRPREFVERVVQNRRRPRPTAAPSGPSSPRQHSSIDDGDPREDEQ